MSKEKQLIQTFYTAFKARDHVSMAKCYHPDAVFRDEVFSLKGEYIGAMWQMLCERGADMEMTFSVTETSGIVTAHWEPTYTFRQTGRIVHNIIDAEFEFKDGKIVNHVDRFNFWRWSRQALGVPGLVLGWSPFLRNKVSVMANKALQTFINKNK
ncbi:nuclear transport factor 2 family protein [Alkalimarinus sediminis]|uniref:Nuclear transport factor 2 family protein n=1 Tax=Alkalimarinus sediminis TaxID=1632866 RepID=A0A9E8HLM2_9ALTE|nr:nuclear transport factor 2 family protein [Alkalimarinus sediminis]UZW76382.1 nuclear transport factor 2 family protein [Alkalimarinus sediminis]